MSLAYDSLINIWVNEQLYPKARNDRAKTDLLYDVIKMHNVKPFHLE